MSPEKTKHEEKCERVQHFLIEAFTGAKVRAVSVGQIAEISAIINPPQTDISSAKDLTAFRKSNLAVAHAAISKLEQLAKDDDISVPLGTSRRLCRDLAGQRLRTVYRSHLKYYDWRHIKSLLGSEESNSQWRSTWQALEEFPPRPVLVLQIVVRTGHMQSQLAITALYIQALRDCDSNTITRLRSRRDAVTLGNWYPPLFRLAGDFDLLPENPKALLELERSHFTALCDAYCVDNSPEKEFPDKPAELEVLRIDVKEPAWHPQPIRPLDAQESEFRRTFIEERIREGHHILVAGGQESATTHPP